MGKTIAVLLMTWVLMASLTAQPPVVYPMPPTDDVPLPLEENPVVRQQIEAALQGQPVTGQPDEVIQGVLQSIRRRGSVLAGSVLDPANETPPRPDSMDDTKGRLHTKERLRAAEALLRAARLLESISEKESSPADSAPERQLVLEMRRTAVKLLVPVFAAD